MSTPATPATPASSIAGVSSMSAPMAFGTTSDKAAELARQLTMDPSKPEIITQLGAQAQQQSAEISTRLLDHVKVGDQGQSGSLLAELALKCKSVNVKSLAPSWRDSLAKIPMLGSLLVGVEKYHSTLDELDLISKKLSGSRDTLMQDSQSLGVLFEQNQVIYNDLQMWIQVGYIKLKEIDAQIAQFSSSQDPREAQRQSDVRSMRDRLDKHVHDLELTAAIRLQNAPNIRIIQSGNIQLAEKLQSSVLNTIPLWKDNLALAITQVRQRQAIELQQKVDDTTNDLLKQSADMLHQNSIAIAKSSVRGVVDIATLEYNQQKLLATIDDVQTIMKDAQGQRDSARTELVKMETELRNKR